MLIIVYAKDIKLFKGARKRIVITILLFTIIDVVAEVLIYSLSAFIIYPAYLSIVEIPHVKIIIFLIMSYIIVDIIISNRNQNYIATELDNSFLSFGVGTGIFWINSKLLLLIEALKNGHSLMLNSWLDIYLEDQYREPLQRQLITRITQISTVKIIESLQYRIEKRNNNNLSVQRFNKIIKQYQQDKDEQKLRERLVELAKEEYSIGVIENWKKGNTPFIEN